MTFERRAWHVALLMAALLILVSVRGAYWQLWRGMRLTPVALDPIKAASEYAILSGEPTSPQGIEEAQRGDLSSLPQPVIQRTVKMLSTIQRGRIFDREGNILAEDIGEPGDFTRIYYDPSLAHVVGYTSALRTGINGLEGTYNETLLGVDRPDSEIDRWLHKPMKGSDLELTIDPDIQRASLEALDGRPGAVVVLDGHTGAVLAMTSAPTFDPNRLTEEYYLSSLGEGVLMNRATQALYTPGSTWKTVTLIAALDSGQVQPDTVFDFGEPRVREDGKIFYVYEVDGGIIPDSTHTQRELDLTMSFAYSANVAFAKMGDDMDPEVMIDYAARMGFSSPNYSRRFPLELAASEPQLANNVDSIRTNNLLRASTGFGQGELLTTPINMAMVVEAVINEGNIPVPYLVEKIRNPDGQIAQNEPYRRLVRNVMKSNTAGQVKEIMAAVVDRMYGSESSYLGINDPELMLGLKTGTAQVGGDLPPHGWLIGFAERGEKSVVIVVVLEYGGGATASGPVFQKVSRAAIEKYLLDGQP